MIWQDQVSSAGRPSRGRRTVRLVSQYSSRGAPDMKGWGHARCAPAPDISHDRSSTAHRRPQHNQASLHLQYHTCDKHLLAYTPLRICYNVLCYLWPLAKTTPWPEQSTREHACSWPWARGDSTTPTSDHNHLGATSKLTTTMREQLLLHQKNYHQGQFRQIIVGLL